MIHPSYSDLMKVINENVEPGEQPVVQSRYSIVVAAAKRARQIVDERNRLKDMKDKNQSLDIEIDQTKPLSVAVDELYNGIVTIEPADE